MDQSNQTKFRTALVYFVAFVALGLSPSILGPTLPGLSEQVSVSLQQIGAIFTTRSLGYLVFSLLAGVLYDRFRGHPIMALGFVGMGIASALVPLSPTLAVLMVLFFLQGGASAVTDVGGNTMILWLYREKVAPYLNALHCTFGVGASSAPLAVALSLSVTGHFSWAYFGIALFTIPVALLVLSRKSPDRADVTAQDDKPPLGRKGLGARVLFFVLYAGCEMGMGWWIYTYAIELQLMGEQEAAFLTTGFWIALTVGRLLTIPVARVWPPRQYLPIVFTGVLLFTGLLWAGAGDRLLVWVATLGIGLSMASVFPSILSFTGRHYQVGGSTNGWFFAGASTGSMIFPWVIGALFEPIGPTAMPMVMLVNLSLSGGLLAYMLAQVRRSAE